MRYIVLLSLSMILVACQSHESGQVQNVAPQASEPLGINALSEGDELPRAMHMVPPIYPKDMLKQNLSGEALCSAIIDKKGRVVDVEVVHASHPSFGRAAVKALRQWRFVPAKIAGKPVNIRIQVPIPFSIVN